MNLSPRLRCIQALGDVTSGLIGGVTFAIVARPSAVLHTTILAGIASCAAIAIWWINHTYQRPVGAAAKRTLSLAWQEVGFVVLPFPVALWTSTYVALAVMPR